MKGCPSFYATYCSPVLLTPKLAKEIGMPRALILKQLQYWLYKPKHNFSKLISECRDNNGTVVKNHRWIKDSYTTLAKQIECLGLSTIKRNLSWLHKHGFIYIANRKLKKQTYGVNWYSINYDKVNDLFIKSKYTPEIITKDNQAETKYGSDSVQNAFRDIKRQNKKLMEALKTSQANEKKLRQAYSGTLQGKGGLAESIPQSAESKGAGSQKTEGRLAKSMPRRFRANHRTNESHESSNENLLETIEERPDQQIKDKMPNSEMPLDKTYFKLDKAYTNIFGSSLTARGSNLIYKLLKFWDADLIIIALNVTATKISAVQDYRIIPYARKILEDYSKKGIKTAKQWHDLHGSGHDHSDKSGGTPSDMRNPSFLTQISRRVSSVRTGKNIFPPVNESDKNNAKIVIQACDVLAKRKHLSRTSFDYDKLCAHDCRLAKSIVESENKENV